MKKWICILLLLSLFAALPVRAEGEAVRVGALTGPTAMGMVKRLDENTYEPVILGSADELVPQILQGRVDIASVPANLAATLYNKTGGEAVVLAVNVLGVLYIGEYNTEEIHTLADLKGKTIYATGKGSTPEYFLRYVLSQNGLDPDRDVTIEWKSEPGEVVALLNQAREGIAMLPQPYVTAAASQLGEGFRVALSISDLWEKLDNGSLCATAVVMARREFAERKPQAVVAFLEKLEESVVWVNEHPEEAAQLCQNYGLIKASVAQRAIPECNLVCLRGERMKQALSGCLEVIFGENPKAVGGELPGSDFYYGAE